MSFLCVTVSVSYYIRKVGSISLILTGWFSLSPSNGSRRGAKSEKGEARFYQKSQADWPRCCPGALWWSSGDNLAVMGDSLLWSSSLRSWDDGMCSARSQLSLRKHNNQSSSQLTVFIQDLLRAGRQHSPEILCAVCDSLIVNLPSSDYLRQSCKQNHPVRYILSPLSHTHPVKRPDNFLSLLGSSKSYSLVEQDKREKKHH